MPHRACTLAAVIGAAAAIGATAGTGAGEAIGVASSDGKPHKGEGATLAFFVGTFAAIIASYDYAPLL